VSDRATISLSAPEGSPIGGLREDIVRKKKDVRHHFRTPSGIRVSIVDRGERGWFHSHKAPWADRPMRHLITKGSRDEAVRLASAEIEELYRQQAVGATPTLLRIASELIVHKEREGRAKDYRRKVEEHMRGYIAPALGADTLVGSLTAKQLLAFKHGLSSSDLDPESCNRILTTLRQILKYAEDPAGYITAPSLPRNFRTPHWKTRERWQILPPPEIAKMLKEAPDDVRPILGYIANTGLRIGSALATEASWIDFGRRQVRYPASAMKGRHAHVVELNTAAEAFLKTALLTSPEKPFDFSYWFVLDRWIALRKKIERPKLRIHDLRHSFVSNQLAAGTPVHVVKDMAAHRSLAVTALYAHSSDEARRAAADRLEISVTPEPAPTKPVEATPSAVQVPRGTPQLRVVK
jgi:integrase